MLLTRILPSIFVAITIAGCGSGTVTVASSATQLWAADTATLTCTLTSPAGTPPAIAQSCGIEIDPVAAGTAPSPIPIPAAAGAAATTFTAGTVTEDTLATVTANWVQAWARDPTGTTAVTVHPPRFTGALGPVSVIVEPSVSRTASGLLRYTFDITTQSGTPLAPSDDLLRFSPTFQAPASLVGASTSCTDIALAVFGTTSQPVAGAATTHVVNCNAISQKLVAVFDVDASPGGVTNFSVILGNAAGIPSGTVGGAVTGPLP